LETHKKHVRVRLLLTKYQKRISGPLINRIGTACHIEVPRVDYEKLSGNKVSETSEVIRQRVQAARNIQQARFTNSRSTDIISNADIRIGEIRQFCKLQACPEHRRRDEGGALSVSKCQSLMRAAMSQLNLSARAYAQHNVIAS